MPIAPIEDMTNREILEYVEDLEEQVRKLTAKTDNTKKLTLPEVSRIRKLHETGNWTQAELAEAFGVNNGTISRIVRNVYYTNAA